MKDEKSPVVVPYVGTWIEILNPNEYGYLNTVVPYVGTWIEIVKYRGVREALSRRSLRGNVDRNGKPHPQCADNGGRSLRGNVDRNR